MLIAPYLAQLVAGYNLNFSPKVVVPGFVGITSLAIACELQHYGFRVDFGSVALVTVQVMVFLGWLVRDPARSAARHDAASALEQQQGAE